MVTATQPKPAPNPISDAPTDEVDVIVIGAGVTGLYSLYRLRQLGFRARSFEEADGVGGTWYWNRYPGARFDSESYTYGYSFSPNSSRNGTGRNTTPHNPKTNATSTTSPTASTSAATSPSTPASPPSPTTNPPTAGPPPPTTDAKPAPSSSSPPSASSPPAMSPDFPGLDSYQGDWCHTNRWPKAGMNLAGKRVGVIGTGATAVQLIPEIVDDVAHLTVFQRTPNYCVPLRNSAIDPDTQAYIKSHFPQIFDQCRSTAGSFMHLFDTRSAFAVTPEERQAQYEKLWAEPGFKKWLANFYDVMMPGPANEDYAEFVRSKIRERVHDPEVAEKLVPKDHMFGSKRLPCESGYYEVYNRPNVLLVDVRESPIARITPAGIRLDDGREYELDVIIFATGYDAVTGSLNKIHIEGIGGQVLKDKFANGPRTYMGMSSAGYPNLFTVNAASVGNFVRAAEPLVEWVTDAIAYVRDHGYRRIMPTPEAEDAWVRHIAEDGAKILRTQANSWFVGANIPGKARVLLTAPDTAPAMRAKRAAVAANGYEGFTLE